MCSSYKSGVDRLSVCFHIVLKFMEHFESGFVIDGSEVSLLEEAVIVINRACHGR